MKTRTHKQVLRMLLPLVIMICFCQCAGAASKAVWQIGEFDQSSGEFNQGEVATSLPPLTPQSDVLYIVGKSKPATTGPLFSRVRQMARLSFAPSLRHPV